MGDRRGRLTLLLLNRLAEAHCAGELPSADGGEAAELEVGVRLAERQQQSTGIRRAGTAVPWSIGVLIAPQPQKRR